MKNILVIILCMLNILSLKAQMIFNDISFINTATSIVNTNAVINGNADFLQNGNLTINQNLEINSQSFQNNGSLNCLADIIIEGNTTFNSLSETYVEGNWLNNGNFDALPNSQVYLTSQSNQDISGESASVFDNLTLMNNGIVNLVNTDVVVKNILNLNNKELATNFNAVTITNTDTNAIIRNNGFVSSLGSGRLVRWTNQINSYLFPVGSSLTSLYRPVIITPYEDTIDTFGVRLSLDENNYDLDTNLCAINQLFYHKLYARNNADYSFIFDSETDGNWPEMASLHNKWSLHQSNLENQDILTIKNKTIDDAEDFVFAIKFFELDLGPDIYVPYQSGKEISIDTYYEPTNTAYQFYWSPQEILTNPDELYPSINSLSMDTNLSLTIIENGICTISDTIRLSIVADQIYIPNSFSPNQDFKNDLFKPGNTNISQCEMTIYDRWGTIVFRTDNCMNGWDGKYKGEYLPSGAYAYDIDYRLIQKPRSIKTARGSVLLIR